MPLRPLHILIYCAAALLLLASCSADGCLENRSSLPKAGFYSMSTGQQIAVDSITITGIGIKADQPLYEPEMGVRISEIYLPMRATQPSTAWQIRYMWHYTGAGALADTIAFDYTSAPYFASEECGVVYNYRITRMTYTRHIIDLVEITDSMVTNIDKERIKIYFRTNDDDDDDE